MVAQPEAGSSVAGVTSATSRGASLVRRSSASVSPSWAPRECCPTLYSDDATAQAAEEAVGAGASPLLQAAVWALQRSLDSEAGGKGADAEVQNGREPAPLRAHSRYLLGTALYNAPNPRYELAAEVLREVLVLAPAHSSAANNLGAVLFHRGDAEGALGAFRTAMNITKERQRARRPASSRRKTEGARQLDDAMDDFLAV